MLTYSVVFFHDNALPHTAAHTQAMLDHCNWELFDHPHYSPDLPPSEYHLLTKLKNRLRSQNFKNNEELMEGVKTWLRSEVVNSYDACTQKLISRCKCLNSGGDSVEK
jgi:transposase